LTTIIPFAPAIGPSSPPFQFQATLDGQIYTCTVTWNVFSQRWYLGVYSLSGVLVVLVPMVGSPNALPLASLTWQSWRGGLVQAVAEAPHWFRVGSVVVLTISSTVPTGFGGTGNRCVITGPSTFTYPLATDPGVESQPGFYSYDVNLVAGYFLTSTLVWRSLNSQFEINP
jgi:hypothetical protein